MSGFMGPSKLSNSVTTLSNRTSLLKGGYVEGEWGIPGWRPGQTIAGNQDFILGAGAQFWSSRDFAEGCHTWDMWGPAYDMLVRFFPYRVYIDSNRRNTLEYEWSLARCCHLVVYLIVLDGWLCLWLLLYYFNNNVNYLIDACFMHAIEYRCKPNTYLN
jgi:hypothetical protein